jgi:hypothetical protein
VRSHATRESRRASDHLPVFADLIAEPAADWPDGAAARADALPAEPSR